jgi:hypothetical protein
MHLHFGRINSSSLALLFILTDIDVSGAGLPFAAKKKQFVIWWCGSGGILDVKKGLIGDSFATCVCFPRFTLVSILEN